MDIRHLEYFLAVVEQGGVNRAAQHLHVAQASVSQAIQQLEREFKLSLFHRTGRNLVLTPAGELLLDPARKVLGDVIGVRDLMRSAHDMQVGAVTIGTMPEMSSEAVAAWSGSFTRAYPDIRLELSEFSSSEELCAEVVAGHCEIGFTTFPVDAEGLQSVGFGEQRLLLVRPPGTDSDSDDGGRSGTGFPMSEIAAVPLVVSSAATWEGSVVANALSAARRPAKIVARVPNRHAQLALVLSGAGSAFLPMRMATAAHRLGAVVVETDPEIRTAFGIVHRASGLSPAASSFVALSRANLVHWHRRIAAHRARGMNLLQAAVKADDELHTDQQRLVKGLVDDGAVSR